jgi:poly-gamma-glutamate synthesis protein (capsule biosynthesis protein)
VLHRDFNKEINLFSIKVLLFFAVAILPALIFEFMADETPSFTILATGDTMLGSWAENTLSDSGYSYPFQKIESDIAGADIFFTNLEAPFGTVGKPFEKRFTFRVKPGLVNVLLAGKINLVSLANNHTMDYGADCLQQTLEILDKHHIKYAGAGINLKEARKPAILSINNKKVGFLSYSLTFPEEFWATDTTAGTCFPAEEFVFQDVSRLKDSCDFVIVSCHWGQELMETPKEYQRELAHQLIDYGADVILGHHPHVVQGVEFYKDKLIAYSLGNFIFGSYSDKARDSFLLKITVLEDHRMVAQIVPINVYNKEVEFRPEPLASERKKQFIEKMNRLSLELNADSIGISSDGFINLVKL